MAQEGARVEAYVGQLDEPLVRGRTDGKPMGFSVLRKDVSSGSFTCDVYLVDRPTRVEDKAAASLGHEVAHCLGFSHE
ncbi:MAG TPA: hypothetical protein VF322_08005 [Gammaproteobacteria bacterium]